MLLPKLICDIHLTSTIPLLFWKMVIQVAVNQETAAMLRFL
jgi:hypothetical protein